MIEIVSSGNRPTRNIRKLMKMTEASMRIEELKIEHDLDTYREACLQFLEECKENYDFADIPRIISSTLHQKLWHEAVSDGFVRGEREDSLSEFLSC